MTRVSAWSVLRCTNARSSSAPRLVLDSIRSNLSTNAEPSSRKSQKQYQQRYIIPKEAQREHFPLHIRSDILHFRRVTDAVNQHLSLSSEGLQAWIGHFLELGTLQLLRHSDCSEVRVVQA